MTTKTKAVKKPTITLTELEEFAEKFNNEPWTFPSKSQKEWLEAFVKDVKRNVTESADE